MPRRYRSKTYSIGDIEIRLQTPRDLGQYTDSDRAFPLFGIVWDSAQVLSELMLDYHMAGEIRGKRILEIGCGMALVSHLLNTLDADITALDIHPVTAGFLSRNAALNNCKPISFVNASWSDKLPDLGDFDLILGSDVLYEPRHIETLAPFLNLHARSRSEVVIVDPDRGQLEDFRKEMSEYGFTCESNRPTFLDRSTASFEGVVDRFTRQPSADIECRTYVTDN